MHSKLWNVAEKTDVLKQVEQPLDEHLLSTKVRISALDPPDGPAQVKAANALCQATAHLVTSSMSEPHV
jgi:hypothetical protein